MLKTNRFRSSHLSLAVLAVSPVGASITSKDRSLTAQGLGNKPPQPIAAKSKTAVAQDRAGHQHVGELTEAKISAMFKRATSAGEQTTKTDAAYGYENGLAKHMALHSGRTHYSLHALASAKAAESRTPATAHA